MEGRRRFAGAVRSSRRLSDLGAKLLRRPAVMNELGAQIVGIGAANARCEPELACPRQIWLTVRLTGTPATQHRTAPRRAGYRGERSARTRDPLLCRDLAITVGRHPYNDIEYSKGRNWTRD